MCLICDGGILLYVLDFLEVHDRTMEFSLLTNSLIMLRKSTLLYDSRATENARCYYTIYSYIVQLSHMALYNEARYMVFRWNLKEKQLLLFDYYLTVLF